MNPFETGTSGVFLSPCSLTRSPLPRVPIQKTKIAAEPREGSSVNAVWLLSKRHASRRRDRETVLSREWPHAKKKRFDYAPPLIITLSARDRT